MSDTKEMLQRARERLVPPEDVMGSLVRRRHRKERNRRISAAVVGLAVTLLSIAFLTQAFRSAERTGRAPTPAPEPQGIFSDIGGRIVYGDDRGIWAVDPARPHDPDSQIHLSRTRGTPLAWARDGSKLLILYVNPRSPRQGRLVVLNANGTETLLTTIKDAILPGGFPSGGSFSPDGSEVIYTERSSMYVVDAQGGTPRQLFSPGPRWSASCPCILRHPWPFNSTYSPDGTQIAYSDGIGDNSHQLRVMNADGSGTHVLVDEQDGHTIHNITWSPDGEWLAFGLGRASGIYVVNADGSGLALVLPDGTYPYLSPDGSRISYQPRDEQSGAFFPLEIAAADGTHVVEFGYGGSGPWNPLVQPEPEVVGRESSEDLTMSLSLVVTLLALVVGAVYLRGRMRRTRGRGA